MKRLLIGLPAFLGRHWLRLLIVAAALYIAHEKRVDLTVRLGGSPEAPAVSSPRGADGSDPVSKEASLLSDLLGNSDGGSSSGGLLNTFSLFGSASGSAPRPLALPDFERLTATDPAAAEAFIRRFAHVAQAEQSKFGIPASITLASGLLLSRAGKTVGATELNAWFALRCGKGYSGDFRQQDGVCLRRYDTAWLAFRGHSTFLTTGDYRHLTSLSDRDPAAWAHAMEKLGYGGVPHLARQLLAVVDHYDLTRFD